MGDGSERGEPQDTHPLRVALSNLALFATVFAFVTVAIRALVVARLDPTTAVALVQTSGPVNVFVGTLTEQLPSFLVPLVFAAIPLLESPRSRESHRRLFKVVFGTVLVICLVIAPWIFTLFLVLFGVLGMRATQLRPTTPATRRVAAIGALGMVILPAGVFLLSPSLWLPQEILDVAGEGRILGYVLEENGRWVSVLEERQRELRILKETEITERQPCTSAEATIGASVAQLVIDLLGDAPDPPDYLPCPTEGV